MDKSFINFNWLPGEKLNKLNFEQGYEPLITVIIPFYNDKDTIEQTVNSVLNQTFPAFELLIIDDGSKEEESLRKLDEIEKMDNRIRVFHKKNEGLAATRDYGASKSNKLAKYLFFIDSDDLIERTYLECAYWTLETHKDASWTYTDSLGFEEIEYTWNKWFDSEKMKRKNDLIASALVRKEDFFEVNGYGLKEKSVNEDWNFWLKMISKEKYPVRMNFYGAWYRRKKNGSELKRAEENKKRTLQIISETSKRITKVVKAIQFPKNDFNWDIINDKCEDILQVKRKDNGKINILMIIPWMVMGGADKFNLDFVNGMESDKYELTIVTTEPAINIFRQQYDRKATVYDLTTFLDQKDWISFINYIINKNNINLIFNVAIFKSKISTNPNYRLCTYGRMV